MSISQNFPEEGPSLNLNFASSKTLDPRITFTRTSSATYTDGNGLIRVAPINSPRFDHRYNSTTGEIESLGLLIEEQRQNLFTWSENLNDVGWSTFLSSVTPNTNISPSGDISADTITFTANQFADINFAVGIQTGITYTASIWARSVSGISTFRIKYWNGSAGTYSSNITVTETWGRYNYTFVGTASTGFPNIGFSNSSDGNSKSVVLWGAQLEQGDFPTSYIPTAATTATRTADNVSITGSNFSNFYNPAEGTVYANTRMVGVQTGRFDRLWAITNSNLNQEGISIYVAGPVGNSGAYLSSVTITSSATEQIIGTPVETAFTTPRLKSAFAFQQNNCASAYNGQERFLDNTVVLSTFTTPLDRLLIGQPQRFQGHSCMTISQLTYYPTRLTNSQLQTLTR